MSRATKWKPEKTKVKVVFRLQFHATHIPQSGWDKLFIAFIPADSGRPTAKTTKANVRNGACKWADPIYETTRLLQDSKSKKYEDKLYNLVVAMGSSRSSILGEATVNLADYADAFKPSLISIPLYGCDFGTVLHVTVQLLTSKTGFREFEQQREIRERGLQTYQNNPDELSGGKLLLSEDIMSKEAFYKTRFKDMASVDEDLGASEESALGFDGSSNTSESQYAEKQDIPNINEIERHKSVVSGDLPVYPVTSGLQSDPRFSIQASSDWVDRWTSQQSADNVITAAFEENIRLREALEVSESSLVELKLAQESLQLYANEIGQEAQKISNQLAAEVSSGVELAKVVSELKSESSKLNTDMETLKVSKSCHIVEHDHFLQELQLRWRKGISILEEKVIDMRNKSCFGYHDREFGFPHSELDAMLLVLDNLKQGTELTTTGLSSATSDSSNLKENAEVSHQMSGPFVAGSGYDLDMYQPELGMLHCLSIPGLVSHGPDSLESINAMKGKLFELLRELDESKVEKETLKKKMDEMECYYEALVQDLEEGQKQLTEELQNLKNDHSTLLYVVSSTKTEMETVCLGLNEQILRLSEDKSSLISLNEKLEKRSTSAEAALKRARLNYSIAVDHLQKDLELLSSQVLSMFETSESLVRRALVDSETNVYGQIEREQKMKFELAQLSQLQNQSNASKNHLSVGGDIFLHDLKKSLALQEGLYKKVDDELFEIQFVNLYLDLLSQILGETLIQFYNHHRPMDKKLNQLLQKLDHSNASEEFLKIKLQTAEHDIHLLDEYNSTYIAKCNEMSQQIQIFESTIQNLTHENSLLIQKVEDYDSLVMQCAHYQSKFEGLVEEKTQLSYLLEKASVDNAELGADIFNLREEFKKAKNENEVLLSTEKTLRTHVDLMDNKVRTFLNSFPRDLMPDLAESWPHDFSSLELLDCLVVLENLLQSANQRIVQLVKDNEYLQHANDDTQLYASSMKESKTFLEQNFEHEICAILEKLDTSNIFAKKLDQEIESLSQKIVLLSDLEMNNVQSIFESISELNFLEDELNKITSDKNGISQDISELSNLTDDLRKSYLTNAELMKENRSLNTCLQDKTGEVEKLALELSHLNNNMLSSEKEKQELITLARGKDDEVAKVIMELHSLQSKFPSLRDENENLLVSLQRRSEETALLASELCYSKKNLQTLQNDNQMLQNSLQVKSDECMKLRKEFLSLKDDFQTLHDDNNVLKISLNDKAIKFVSLESELSFLQKKFDLLHDDNQTLTTSLQEKSEQVSTLLSECNYFKGVKSMSDEKQVLARDRAVEINAAQVQLQSEINSLGPCSTDRTEESTINLQLDTSEKLAETDQDDHQSLVELMKNKDKETKNSVLELDRLRKVTQSLHEDLLKEKNVEDQLKLKVDELTLVLIEKDLQLVEHQTNESELLHLKEIVSRLESETYSCENPCLNNSDGSSYVLDKLLSRISCFESHLFEIYEHLVAGDLQFVFVESLCDGWIEEYPRECNYSENRYFDDDDGVLNQRLESTMQCILLHRRLLTSLDHIKPTLDTKMIEISSLFGELRDLSTQLQVSKLNPSITKLDDCGVMCQFSSKCSTKFHHSMSDEEFDDLIVFKERIEVECLLLQAKLLELQVEISSLEAFRENFFVLKQQYNDLTRKLSDQELKTEEFRNLSHHFKELADKTNAESMDTSDKRESGTSSFSRHESLRIAFMREQYESKLQDMIQQLQISKKHSEELLFKLQDSLNEIESRKKSEVSLLKQNEELGMHILDLEAELQFLLSEKRGKVKAYDLMKADMESSLNSLNCCKEEKRKLEAALEESMKEKSNIETELSSLKDLLQQTKVPLIGIDKQYDTANEDENTLPCDSVNSTIYQNHPMATSQMSNSRDNIYLDSSQHNFFKRVFGQSTRILSGLSEKSKQGLIVSVQEQRELNGDMNRLALINDQFRNVDLKSCMDSLTDELEKMKNDSSSVPTDNLELEQIFPELQHELLRLQKANEELETMFPTLNGSEMGNSALERVLCSEIELAEALRLKTTSGDHFHSFLQKQSDEESVLKSFRDINELIKDMLEIKGKYKVVETELKDMHDRYSQLSLKFAEVEGERQKLMMTLRNVRSPMKSSSSGVSGEN